MSQLPLFYDVPKIDVPRVFRPYGMTPQGWQEQITSLITQALEIVPAEAHPAVSANLRAVRDHWMWYGEASRIDTPSKRGRKHAE